MKKHIVNRQSKAQMVRMAECWASDTNTKQAVYTNKQTNEYNYCDVGLKPGSNWVMIGIAYPTGYSELYSV